MNKRWVCNDVWMDIFPHFNRPQLGLKLALISNRFDVLVDTHFDGKKELTIWREITIKKGKGPKAKMSVRMDGKWMAFPLPDHPLPNKIRFNDLQIEYIDHSVIEFLRSNKPIWDRNGTDLELYISNDQPIWDVLASQIWPIFAPNIRHLSFSDDDDLDNLRRHTSPTILTDLDQLTINSNYVLPDVIADDGPNATACKALSKWLYTPTTDGKPKRLLCHDYSNPPYLEWINNFKEAFRRATTSVSYKIQFCTMTTMSIEQFEVVNEATNEKLTLEKVSHYSCDDLLLKRCPIIVGETATIQWENDKILDDKLNNFTFMLNVDDNCIGPLSPPPVEEEKEKADE